IRLADTFDRSGRALAAGEDDSANPWLFYVGVKLTENGFVGNNLAVRQSISRWTLDVIDNNRRNLPGCGSETQTELFLQRSEQRGRRGVARPITIPNQLEIELTF